MKPPFIHDLENCVCTFMKNTLAIRKNCIPLFPAEMLTVVLFPCPAGKKCTRLSKSDIRVQIVHSDHNATRGGDDEEDVKEPMVGGPLSALPESLLQTSPAAQALFC